jgi:hypothetical protein
MNLMRSKKLAALAVLLANGFFSGAQDTNVAGGTAYSDFRVIAERNIFNPDRYPRTSRTVHHRSTPRPVSRSAPAFALVGTMDYQKGMFAFFDGNNADYRKVLERNGVVAGYTVTQITLYGVKLAAAGKEFEMKIGAQLRQNSEGKWEFSNQSELPASADAGGDTAPASTATPAAAVDPSLEANDVLKKLMQKRAQELSK